MRTGSYNTIVNGDAGGVDIVGGSLNTGIGPYILGSNDNTDVSQFVGAGSGIWGSGILGGGGTFLQMNYGCCAWIGRYSANMTAAGSGNLTESWDYMNDNTAIGEDAMRVYVADQDITGIDDLGDGTHRIRVALAYAQPFPTGRRIMITDVVGTGAVSSLNSKTFIANYIDTTHIFLQNLDGTNTNWTALGGSYTSGGYVVAVWNSATAMGFYAGNVDIPVEGDTSFGAYTLQGGGGGAPLGPNKTAIGYGAGTNNWIDFIGENTTSIGYFSDQRDAMLVSPHMIRITGDGLTGTISGQVGWTATSDRRVKKDIADSDLGLGFIRSLRPVSYRLKKGNGRLDYGFIAQDVQKALGSRATNMVTPGKGKSWWTLTSEELIAPLVAAIQERQRNIDRQQVEIEDLKAQIALAERDAATFSADAKLH
jgi:hypothetical protein